MKFLIVSLFILTNSLTFSSIFKGAKGNINLTKLIAREKNMKLNSSKELVYKGITIINGKNNIAQTGRLAKVFKSNNLENNLNNLIQSDKIITKEHREETYISTEIVGEQTTSSNSLRLENYKLLSIRSNSKKEYLNNKVLMKDLKHEILKLKKEHQEYIVDWINNPDNPQNW